MCGICGGIGDLRRIEADAMSHALEHRGPDDHGEFRAGLDDGREVFLANRRLAIIDPSPRGHQPMATPDGRFTVVFNGEIYNFREIASTLKSSGVTLHGASDTEVVLHAWQRWGPACLERFRGMFAFALFDALERRLFLARDRLGEKPLYYWSDGRTFLFASEVRCLLSSGVVPRRMDTDGLDAFLTFGSVADPYTIVQGVRALEPGHFAEVVAGQSVGSTYWSLAAVEEHSNGIEASAAAEEVGALLRDACRLAMESDVPVGVLLSGGIDSTSNVVMLSELGFDNLRTFSVGFPSGDSALSEERWSSLVAERFGSAHKYIEVGIDEAKEWVIDGVARMDQPSIDGINTYLVTRAIAAAGIKVAVSGQGGDELFLGYPQRHRFPALARLAGLRLPWPAGPLARSGGSLGSVADTSLEKLAELLPASDDPAASAYLANHSLFSQGGVERLRGEKRPSQRRFVRSQGGLTNMGRLSRLQLAYYLRNTLLRDADQMSMANSVELRQPMLDVRLVERVLEMPAGMKVRKGVQKPLLVDAVGSALPHEIVDRPKMGFNLPYDRWVREGLVLTDPLEVAMGLDPRSMRDVHNRFAKGAYWTRYWALQVLAAWVERHDVGDPE